MRTFWTVFVVSLAACSGDPTPATDGGARDAPDALQQTADAGPDAQGAGGTVDAGPCTGSSAQPRPRGDASGVVDPATGLLYVFGGDSGPTVMCIPAPSFEDDTWRYDPRCDAWTDVSGDVRPSARSRMAYALDTRRRRMVIFGGRYRAGASGTYTLFNDVWALDLATGRWQPLTPTGTGPSARSNAAAVYDPVADALVIYGGNTNPSGLAFTPRGDAWALDLATLAWRAVATTTTGTRPPARLFHPAAVQGRSMLVVSGGDTNAFTGPFLPCAWRLDLATDTWTELPLGGDPAVYRRINAALTPDATDGWLLVAGHDDGALGNRNDVLHIGADGAVSTLQSGDQLNHPGAGFCSFPPDFTTTDMNAPERRSAFVLAADPVRHRALVYGGKTDCGLAGDVWTVDLATGALQPLRATTDGVSCTRSGRTGCTALCE